MTYIRKKEVKKRRPVRRRPVGRYGRKSSRASVTAIVKKQLSKAIEKKTASPVFSLPGSTIPFAGQTGANQGWSALDVNPDIPQNVTQSGRIGNRVGITSFHFQFNLAGQSEYYARTPYKICLVLRKNNSATETPNQTVENLWLVNPFTNLRDSNSSLNVNQMANYQILRTARGVLPASQTVNSTSFPTPAPAVVQKQFSFGYKAKTPLVQRYNEDNSLTTVRNSMVLVFLAGANTDNQIRTGINAQFYADFYYQDA